MVIRYDKIHMTRVRTDRNKHETPKISRNNQI
jgi:hypothetical protein